MPNFRTQSYPKDKARSDYLDVFPFLRFMPHPHPPRRHFLHQRIRHRHRHRSCRWPHPTIHLTARSQSSYF